MRMSHQNLNEKGSAIWHGRSWFRSRKTYEECARLEWMFGRKSGLPAAYVTFGADDDERGIMFHLAVPFLFSVFLTLHISWIRAKERRLGVCVHNTALWIYIFDQCWGDGSNSKQKWYQRYYTINFPWQYDWFSTEVLEHKANLPGLQKTLFIERQGEKRSNAFEAMRESEPIKKSATEIYDYVYALKGGKIQIRKASVYVSRMTWIMRGYPVLPFKKIRTSINISFDGEVGERSGSWKGGCVGCGYEMKVGETPLETLRRMERERKF